MPAGVHAEGQIGLSRAAQIEDHGGVVGAGLLSVDHDKGRAASRVGMHPVILLDNKAPDGEGLGTPAQAYESRVRRAFVAMLRS